MKAFPLRRLPMILRRLPMILSWAALCLSCWALLAWTAGTKVTCRGGEIDLRADATALSEVLRHLSDAVGFSVESEDPLDETVTLEIQGGSLEACLGRILRERNYVLLFERDARGRDVPRTLRILGRGDGKGFSHIPSTGRRGPGIGQRGPGQPVFPTGFKGKILDQRLFSRKVPQGIRVDRVPRDSLLWQAGLRDGDVVRDVNGKAVRDAADFLRELQRGTRTGGVVRIGRSTEENAEDPIYLEFRD